jgi:signal transduction histidine kinase
MSLADNDFLAYFLIPYIFGLVTLFIGLLVFWLRPNQLVARLTLAFCVTLAIFMAGLYDIDNTYALVPFWLLATLFIGSSLAMLALVFPVKVITLYHRPWLLWSPLALNAVIAVVAFVIYFRPPSPQLFILPYQLALFTAIAAMIVFMIALLRRRAVATSAVIRDQSNIVLVGILLTLSPVSIWVLTTVLGPSAPFYLNTSAVMPFFIMPPIGLAYAVLQHRVVDSDKVISQGITYGIMLVGLIAGYFLLVLGAQQIVRDVFRIKVSDTFLIALTIFAIAVAFLPVRNLLQRRIDGLYFRVRSNYREQVEAFTRELTSLGELNQLADAFQKQLTSSLSPSSAFVFLPDRQTGDFVALGKPGAITDVRFGANSPLVDLLNKTDEDLIYLDPLRPWPVELRSERSRLMILKAMVIGRLRGQQQLVGFVVIGPPLADYKIYKYEQLRFLQSLTNQMAIAVERSQVVESLERRVRELDVLSRVGQAVNFVLGFDDLLELINTQTDQVVPSANFYIVLRDKTSDRLYFAFFLEDNERDHNKENRRWLMGRDLFSEVVRTENAVRVEDYMTSMAQRNSPIIYENPNLRGWMGVPLIAGTHTLGVMAVAATESGKTYSNDQLRIFGDIASLAATSIDKAQLFAETNLRARQLSVLNDISRQLSSELKVDNLLTLITSSAVEILDAEAGSLLLMTDDGKELEFKVAVGSSGQDLVGKRFPAKRGLAGEVATTGKPVIVNDAANDPRWGGEVAKGRFSTTAVLAVPLIAQGRVIGVLEVLNKKSGGQYVKEDADLLTTFAGQAAIAIENARLFAATDQQLKERVEELQALERIDVELNRSLDLQKVADITRKWAIAQSGASAGLLGLVVGSETKQLRILSQYGYNEEDYPEGSEGMLWPLDRGVVSRVMRTRLPDLATDLKIDPDYVPSLQDALCQLTIPMLSGGEVIAMLILEKDREPRLNLVDMAFAQRLAEHASIALQNALVNEELTRANQSKSEFVSFVAHELKTPMTSIRGFADLLISGVSGKLSEQQSSFLGTIRSNVDRMNTLVSDLNDVTKLQTNNMRMEFSPIDFRNVVSETLRPLHKQIEDKKQILTVTFPDDTPNVMADQNRLIQVLTNLVSNAYKYTPSGGQITISGEVWEKTLTKKGRDLGPSLHIRVKDSGIGLSEHDQAKLFTPYFRSDNPLAREQPGTGLGLTITKGIIEQHGGMIWLESALGEGTAFHLTIPLAPAVEAEEPEPQVVK